MKRYVKYIVTLVVALMAVACTFTDIDQIVTPTVSGGAGFSIVSRVISYTDYDVATRAPKDPAENNITMADYVIMNNDQRCIFYAHSSNTVLTLDKTALAEQFANMPDTTLNGLKNGVYTKLTNCSVYVIANYPEVKAAVDSLDMKGDNIIGKGLDFFQKIKSDVKGVTLPTSGLPMIGVHGEGANVDFSTPGLDNITAGTTFVANLVCLYAKIAFTIDVEAIQTTPNKPTLSLESFAVSNLATTVDMWPGQESGDNETVDDTKVYGETFSGDLTGNLTTIHGGTPITFYCYLPERFLIDGDASAFEYPFGEGSSIREEDKKYRQRYKPLLAQGYKTYNEETPSDEYGNRKATYVTLNGVYTTHQGHSYDVSYDIYVGNDNYSNFDIVRNRQYNNSVTIKGIDTSIDNAASDAAVSVDHRVTVKRSSPLVVNLRRETLLDSHCEVRPLRLRLKGDKIPTGTSATVEVLNEDGTSTNVPTWIRLEYNNGTGSATDYHCANGKRKYFTTDLVTNTLAGNTSVTASNLTKDNQTIWIYVDENTPANATTTKSTRSAMIRVTYNGDNGFTDVKEYIIKQYNMHKIDIYNDNGDLIRYYLIESFEEYLYNFDAEDAFFDEDDKPTTQIQGMPWGLNGVQLSNKYRSFKCDEGALNDWFDDNTDKIPYYDFYIGKHDSFASANGGTVRNYAGQEFTKEIAENNNAGVKALTMADQAGGAVEYCYNRNKRKSDGSIDKVEWYLPAADELEEIIVKGYSSFKEFQENYYWTSQPAYIRNIFYYEYDHSALNRNMTIYTFDVYDDNTEYARATKVISLGNDNYDYIKSGLLNGLKEKPVDFDDDTKRYDSECLDRGCFYLMYIWRREATLFGGNITFTPFYKGDGTAFGGDQEYDEKRNSNTSLGRYHVHLGHLYDMIQKTNGEDGYHKRTINNRVRCLYKKVN